MNIGEERNNARIDSVSNNKFFKHSWLVNYFQNLKKKKKKKKNK